LFFVNPRKEADAAMPLCRYDGGHRSSINEVDLEMVEI
jgi:hypothetical protein